MTAPVRRRAEPGDGQPEMPVPETAIAGTDASYHLPAFYELWARWGPVEDRAFWARAADVSRDLFARVTDPAIGLAPDRSIFDLTPATGWDGRPSQFGYGSWRTVSNWSVDYGWWGKDARQRVLRDCLQRFLRCDKDHSIVYSI